MQVIAVALVHRVPPLHHLQYCAVAEAKPLPVRSAWLQIERELHILAVPTCAGGSAHTLLVPRGPAWSGRGGDAFRCRAVPRTRNFFCAPV